MRHIWEAKDIEAGRFIIRNSASAPLIKENIGFARTVTFKIGFSYDSPKDKPYGWSNPFADGLYLSIGTKEEIAKQLNEDKFGYRPLTKPEAILMIDDMRQSLLL